MSPVEGDKAFARVTLGELELRYRFVRAGAFEGMCPSGLPSDELVRHHERWARRACSTPTA
jgi:2,4-dienoyl-CoA reductase-like NADH-dependent reductase (Old Yellow Enzyme family)